jgi:hypothetical protein
MNSVTDEAALAKVFRPDTAINLSPQGDTAVHLSGEIREYITAQLGLVSPVTTKEEILLSTPLTHSHRIPGNF